MVLVLCHSGYYTKWIRAKTTVWFAKPREKGEKQEKRKPVTITISLESSANGSMALS